MTPELLDTILYFGITFAGGFLVGRALTRHKVGSALKRGVKGHVFALDGQAYILSPVPDMPDFPGFARQKGSPSGVVKGGGSWSKEKGT